MKKKLAIIKNGYDILRIIEGKSDGDNCEFKICFMNGTPETITVSYQQLFSKPLYLEFDNTKEWEITYHKSTISKPTKIHIKRKEVLENELRYINLPLKELIDPDVNTEIPIPLFEMHVSEKALKNKYQRKKDHMVIDIKDNNCVQFFMTKAIKKGENLLEKWYTLNSMLMNSSMQFWVTNSYKYITSNVDASFHSMKDEESRVITTGCNISDDVGIFINTIKVSDWITDKLELLFIENAAYLTLLTHSKYYDEENSKIKYIYEKDFKNEKYFDDKERQKWKYIFEKTEKKTKKMLNKYNDRYETQEKLFELEMEKVSNLKKRCKKFLDALLLAMYDVYSKLNLLNKNFDQKNLFIKSFDANNIDFNRYMDVISTNQLTDIEMWFLKDLISHSRNIHALLAKYLGLKEFEIFIYIIKGKTNDTSEVINVIDEEYKINYQCVEFENIRLLYNDEFDIELLRGGLNRILNVKKEDDFIITKHQNNYENYINFAMSSKLIEDNKFDIINPQILFLDEKNFEKLLNADNCLLERIYNLILEYIDK